MEVDTVDVAGGTSQQSNVNERVKEKTDVVQCNSQQRVQDFNPEYILPKYIQNRLNNLFKLENKDFLQKCIETSSPFLANNILLEKFEKINYKFCFLVDSKKNGDD